jgi:hypothetical protein
MLYGSAKPCGFSIAKVTFLGHARAARSQQRPFAPGAEALEGAAPHLFRPMYATANMGHPSREAGLAHCEQKNSSDSALRHQKYSVLLLRCAANLNKASDTVFSLSVGSKAIL